MAYMGKEKKAKIEAALKDVIPASWRWSLSVRHHSAIVLTIRSAPVDVLGEWLRVTNAFRQRQGWQPLERIERFYTDINEFHMDKQFDGELLVLFEKIKAALNLGNYDNSDVQSDYFDVGHYVTIRLGEFGKPFIVKGN